MMYSTLIFFTDAIESINYAERLQLAYILKISLSDFGLEKYSKEVFKNKNVSDADIESAIDNCYDRYNSNDKEGYEYFKPFNFAILELLICMKALSYKDRLKIVSIDINSEDIDQDLYISDYVKIEYHELKNLDNINEGYTLYDLICEKEQDIQQLIDNNIIKK